MRASMIFCWPSDKHLTRTSPKTIQFSDSETGSQQAYFLLTAHLIASLFAILPVAFTIVTSVTVPDGEVHTPP